MISLGGEDLFFRITQYTSNGRMAIRVIDSQGGPYATLTVNVNEVALADGEFCVKDWSGNQELARACLASGYFEDTGRRVPSGYVDIPVWRFSNAGKASIPGSGSSSGS